MRILGLYNNSCALPLFDWLRGEGHEVLLCTGRLRAGWCREQKIDLAVSYTYRHILSGEILSELGGNAVNLHNSFLPWNRGADPSLWSIVDRTPRGVTLHYMVSSLDKGPVICQRLVPLLPDDTLKTSYAALDQAAQEQFRQAFEWYDFWPQMRKEPVGAGSYHSISSGSFFRKIIDTYDMPIEKFREYAENLR